MLKIGQNWGKIANYPPQCSTKIGTTAHGCVGICVWINPNPKLLSFDVSNIALSNQFKTNPRHLLVGKKKLQKKKKKQLYVFTGKRQILKKETAAVDSSFIIATKLRDQKKDRMIARFASFI